MAKDIKPIPAHPADVINNSIESYMEDRVKPTSDVDARNRGEDISRRDDNVKDVSIGLEDIDQAVLYYFENVIKPTVIHNNNRINVPVIYGFAERWSSVQKDGFYRDKNGKLMVPIIMIKRDSITPNKSLGNKLDGNKPLLHQVIGSKYNARNQYDAFGLLNNRVPSEQLFISTVPDYVTIRFSCIIFTDFVEQNNKLIEAIQFASDAYWGDPKRFKFRSTIDSFNSTTILEQGAERAAKSAFGITLDGYLIPDSINKDLAITKSKYFSKSQISFTTEFEQKPNN